jgi:lipoate-protein ligase A
MTTDSTGANEVTLVSALSIALKGCRYSELAGRDAIDKIGADIPGLVNEENYNIANGIVTWIHEKLA